MNPAAIVVLTLLLFGCLHQIPMDALAITVEPANVDNSQLEASKQREKLELSAKAYHLDLNESKDVQNALIAMQHSEEGSWEKALPYWAKAISTKGENIGEFILCEWTKSLIESPHNFSLAKASEIIFNTLRSGTQSPFMRAKKLTTSAAIFAFTQKNLQPDKPPRSVTPLSRPLDSDPLLVKTSEELCKHPQWLPQIHSLDLDTTSKIYLKGLVFACLEKPLDAIAQLKSATKYLVQENHPKAVTALHLLGFLMRRNGEREGSSEVYQQLVQLWKTSTDLTPESLNVTQATLLLKKSDHFLWSARQLLLQGERAVPLTLVQEALDGLELVPQKANLLTQDEAKELTNLKAEGYYILAFQMSAQAQDWKGSIQSSNQALGLKNLNKEWQQKFLWILGFALYKERKFNEAIQEWTRLQTITPGEDHQAKILFWKARAYAELGLQESMEKHLDRLRALYPLSFYSVLAPNLSGLDTRDSLVSFFGTPLNLRQRIEKTKSYKLYTFRQNSEMKEFLGKSELLIASNLKSWAGFATKDANRKAQSTFSKSKNLEGFLYLSRLLYASKEWALSMALTSELSFSDPQFWKNYPDQIFMFFPSPYWEIFRHAADETTLPVSLLLGIARQESSFRFDVKSPAGAYGIMQLIPVTAQNIAESAKIPLGDIPMGLKNPETNIALGSRYLAKLYRHFGGQIPHTIAAYNAGEFAVESWLTHLDTKDLMSWLEMIPFKETRDYVRSVWRNIYVYDYLRTDQELSLIENQVVSRLITRRLPKR